MLSFAKKLSKRGSEREENTQNQTENAKTDIQDDLSSTSQHMLVGTLLDGELFVQFCVKPLLFASRGK